MLTVLAGGERFRHMQWWGYGREVFERAFDVNRFAKASTSLTRFWNKFDSHRKSEAWSERARAFAPCAAGLCLLAHNSYCPPGAA